MRIGMHCGPVVAGVIGKQKFTYDMWGDTVNVAARMESHGLPGEIHISEAMADKLKEKYLLAQRGWVEVKGKGLLQTFWVKQKESLRKISAKEDTLEMSVEEVNEVSSTSRETHISKPVVQPTQDGIPKKKEARWATKYQKKVVEEKPTVPHRNGRTEEVAESVLEQSGKKVLGKVKNPCKICDSR